MRNPAVRFILAALLAALVAVTVATLTLPFAAALGWEGGAGAGHETIFDRLVMAVSILPFALAIGGMIALPTALAMGGVMVWLTASAPRFDRTWVWMLAAIIGTVPVQLFVLGGSLDRSAQDLVMTLWPVLGAIAGALAFRWLWRRGAAPPA
jgi:hypothetical protein